MSEPQAADTLIEQGRAREPRWRRILWPHSYNPATGTTHVRLFLHPLHLHCGVNRLRWRWMAWRQRNA